MLFCQLCVSGVACLIILQNPAQRFGWTEVCHLKLNDSFLLQVKYLYTKHVKDYLFKMANYYKAL